MNFVIPGWVRVAAPILLAVSICFFGVWIGKRHVEKQWELENAKREAKEAQAVAEKQEREREKEKLWNAENRRIADDAQTQIDAARRDAASAAVSSDRLRDYAAKLAKRCTSGNSKATSSGTSAETAGDMLSDMLQKSVDRNRKLAEYADSARIAGQACEQAYDVLAGWPP